MYENGHHLHHYLSSHHTPPIHQSVASPPVANTESLEKVYKTSENNSYIGNESKVAFVAPLESRKDLGDKKEDEEIKRDTNNSVNGDICNNRDKMSSSSPELKTKDNVLEGTNETINSMEMTRIELEYKLKEKQQLLEIELLRQRLAETERAMANIISKMDMIPTQGQKVSTSFLPLILSKK